MTQASGRVSDEAVRRATGRGWDDWLAVLDEAGAAGWEHGRLVAHLEPHVESGWWRQSIAVRYEQDRGGRVLGQTRDAGFQVGVRRTVDATAEQAWQLLTTRTDLWLGAGDVRLEKGATYEVDAPDGPVPGEVPGEVRAQAPGQERGRAPGPVPARVRGQVRVVKPGDRLRLTWQPDGWPAPATLQLTLLTSSSGRTAIGVHVEKLADADAREQARMHWRAVLERLEEALAPRPAPGQAPGPAPGQA